MLLESERTGQLQSAENGLREKDNNLVVKRLREQMDQNVKIDISDDRRTLNTESIIKNANNKFLLDVLSPEISKNEQKKRIHKDKLLFAVEVFLGIQFLVVFLIVGYSLYSVVYCHRSGVPFSDETIQLVFTFIGAYITSVVVELIAILNFIVKNVFDTSIAELVKIFRETQ